MLLMLARLPAGAGTCVISTFWSFNELAKFWQALCGCARLQSTGAGDKLNLWFRVISNYAIFMAPYWLGLFCFLS
jgi:hypothetical protein